MTISQAKLRSQYTSDAPTGVSDGRWRAAMRIIATDTVNDHHGSSINYSHEQ